MAQLQILDWQRKQAVVFPARSKLATPFEAAIIERVGLRRWGTSARPYDGSRAAEQWDTRARRRALAEIRQHLLSGRQVDEQVAFYAAIDCWLARGCALNALSRAGMKLTPEESPWPIAWGVTGDLTRDNWIAQVADRLAVMVSWRAKGQRGTMIACRLDVIENPGDLPAFLVEMGKTKRPEAIEVWADRAREHGALLSREDGKATDRMPAISAKHFQVIVPSLPALERR